MQDQLHLGHAACGNQRSVLTASEWGHTERVHAVVAPEPEDPTMCGDERFGRFKCAEIEKPGAYLKKAQEQRLSSLK